MWLIYALLSAIFAASTSLLAKAGIDGVLGEGACHVLSIRPQGGVEAFAE